MLRAGVNPPPTESSALPPVLPRPVYPPPSLWRASDQGDQQGPANELTSHLGGGPRKDVELEALINQASSAVPVSEGNWLPPIPRNAPWLQQGFAFFAFGQ
jgi:hypothetical protein